MRKVLSALIFTDPIGSICKATLRDMPLSGFECPLMAQAAAGCNQAA
jgi:hypothetical protein